MITLTHSLAGAPVTVRVPERPEDLSEFYNWIKQHTAGVGLDTEATGLDIYAPGFDIRTVQFGSGNEAFVLPVEQVGREAAIDALGMVEKLALHNASYDLQVLERTMGVPMEQLWPKVIDTRILAHLVNPLGRDEGGPGHSLEDTVRFYIDADVADGVKNSMRELAKEHKVLKSQIFKEVYLFDPKYLLYAGMDAVLAVRLYGKLRGMVPGPSQKLVATEHKLAEVCSYLDRKGFLLDVDYATDLSGRLLLQEEQHIEAAVAAGCQNVFSPDQVAEVFLRSGVKIPERTPTGKPKVDKVFLERRAAAGDSFAEAVIGAKHCRKWRTTWVDRFLKEADQNGRCHAFINPLRARTARMSITGIPAQTLPTGDSVIRRCFVADEGQSIVSCDYQSQELRVLAALSRDRTMVRAIRENADLHQFTADSASVDRKIGKMANFLTVYGGGAGKLATAADIDLPLARDVLAAFKKTYQGITRYAKALQQEAQYNGQIITPSGRVLPVDRERPYAALNYMVQSTSRDVTARAMIRLHEAGFTPYLRLPIHDEILASVPAKAAQWGAERIAEIMEEKMGPVMITADSNVYGYSWGDGYVAEGAASE